MQFSSLLIYESAGGPVLICKNNWPLMQAIIQFSEMKLQKPSLVQKLKSQVENISGEIL